MPYVAIGEVLAAYSTTRIDYSYVVNCIVPTGLELSPPRDASCKKPRESRDGQRRDNFVLTAISNRPSSCTSPRERLLSRTSLGEEVKSF